MTTAPLRSESQKNNNFVFMRKKNRAARATRSALYARAARIYEQLPAVLYKTTT